MASNSYKQQFFFSQTNKLTGIHGLINLVVAVKATLVTQGLTLTAAAFGTSGNSITLAITGGATAGAEVVSVSGNAISVQIQSGVSTVTQVRTALAASAPATALAVTTGTSGSAVVSAAALALSGGINGVSSDTIVGASAARSGVGEYTITLDSTFPALMSAQFTLQAATAVDLVPQIKSVDVTSAKTIVVRLLAGATATELAAPAVLHMALLLRNSSVVI